MPGGTVHDGAYDAEVSIGGALRTTTPSPPDSRDLAPPVTGPQLDSPAPPLGSSLTTPQVDDVAAPRGAGDGVPEVVTGSVVPRTDALGRPLAGDGIDPAERTPRSFHLSRSLLERARAAAYWLAQLPDRNEPTNVSELVERALSYEVARLEQAYNNGTPFPAVVGRMRTGPGASGVERIRRAQRARRRQDSAGGSTDPDPSPGRVPDLP